MKRAVLVIAALAVVAGCRNFQVVVKDDQFSKAKVVTLAAYHDVAEGWMSNTSAVYTKDIKNGKQSDPVITMDFWATIMAGYKYHGEDLDEKAQILIDGKVFDVKLTDRKKSKQSNLDISTSRVSGSIDANVNTNVTLSAKLRLTPDIQKTLAAASVYKIRMTAGNEVLVLNASAKQLEAVKLFLAADGSQPAGR